jgi:hypothetical protein
VGLDLPVVAALAPIAQAIGLLAIPCGMAMGAAAVLVRFRRARGPAREQHKWFLAAVAAFAISLPPAFLDGAAGVSSLDAIAISSLALLPMAIGIAILRYRLYDIDRIVSRTVGWAVVTLVLVLAFGAAVIGLQAVLSGVTQGQTLAVAASTLVAFALFQPIRRRVQAGVDRRFDRARINGERTASAFAERLRAEVAMEAVAANLTGTVRDSVRPAVLGLWLRGGTP